MALVSRLCWRQHQNNHDILRCRPGLLQRWLTLPRICLAIPKAARRNSSTKCRNPDLGPISIFVVFNIFYQDWVNGLDLNRFCALNTLYKCKIHRFVAPLVKISFLIRTIIFTNRCLFSNLIFFVIFAKPLYQKFQNVRIDHRIIFTVP